MAVQTLQQAQEALAVVVLAQQEILQIHQHQALLTLAPVAEVMAAGALQIGLVKAALAS